MSILSELYDGNINPSERYIKEGSDYEKLNKKLTEYIDELVPLLNNEEKQICEKIRDTVSDLGYISEKECFMKGFRIGAQIVWEIINFKSDNYI